MEALKKVIVNSLLILFISALSIGCTSENNGEFSYTSYLNGKYGNGKEFKLTAVIDGTAVESEDSFVIFQLDDSNQGRFTFVNLIPGVSELSCNDIPLVDNQEMQWYEFEFSKTISDKVFNIEGHLFWGEMSLTITTM